MRAFPFSDEVQAFLDQHEQVFVVEQNRDAQLRSLLLLETEVAREKLISILNYSGLPMDCRCIIDGVSKVLEKGVVA